MSNETDIYTLGETILKALHLIVEGVKEGNEKYLSASSPLREELQEEANKLFPITLKLSTGSPFMMPDRIYDLCRLYDRFVSTLEEDNKEALETLQSLHRLLKRIKSL